MSDRQSVLETLDMTVALLAEASPLPAAPFRPALARALTWRALLTPCPFSRKTKNEQLECQSESLVSSVSLLRDMLQPGGRVYAACGVYLSRHWLESFVALLWNLLPKDAAGMQTATWLDHAAALVEGVTVALLEQSQAPRSSELSEASERTLRLANDRLRGLKHDRMPEVLEAVQDSVRDVRSQVDRVSLVGSELSLLEQG